MAGWSNYPGPMRYDVPDGRETIDPVTGFCIGPNDVRPRVSLAKEYGITMTQECGMDRAAWNSTVLLPMYLSTIFDRPMAVAIYGGLTANRPSALAQLLWVNEHYDNTTGELS